MLRIESLDAYYGHSHILHGISLGIEAGESVGLLGRNGMGKTTLIRSLMGLVPGRRGRLQWRGQDVSHHAPEQMARLGIGYVPEGRGIFANLSVRENLMMSARRGPGGRCDWDFNKVMDTFPRLAERLDHGGQQLSGGEQQMLSIGRALMTNPELLILDEATEGLAPLIMQEIWRVIGAIRKTGISTLTVDRNYSAVLAHADVALVLEKGRIVESGSAAQLLAAPEKLARYLGV
jgi:branched-chain amino acid transport system ATP-binding protein